MSIRAGADGEMVSRWATSLTDMFDANTEPSAGLTSVTRCHGVGSLGRCEASAWVADDVERGAGIATHSQRDGCAGSRDVHDMDSFDAQRVQLVQHDRLGLTL